MDELKLRVDLQKKYSKTANGSIVPLNRFIKEITNYIIYKKNFEDFKLLNSISDEQIDYTYMFNSTAKHNEVKSMQYIQQKLISHKDENMLHSALEYAIKSQSFDTTLHLMQQKIKLDDKSQEHLLGVLHKEEYEVFYKKISGNYRMLLPSYSKENVIKKRKMAKKTFSVYESNCWDTDLIYEYLTTLLHNSLVELYLRYMIDEFDLYFNDNKAYVTTYSKTYPMNFMKEFESSLYKNGFDSWSEDLLYLYAFEIDGDNTNTMEFNNIINEFIYKESFSIYDFINLNMM